MDVAMGFPPQSLQPLQRLLQPINISDTNVLALPANQRRFLQFADREAHGRTARANERCQILVSQMHGQEDFAVFVATELFGQL